MKDTRTPWEKQRDKMRMKLEDPEWREAQREKSRNQLQRQRDKQREKLASPEYREKQRKANLARVERSREKAKDRPKKAAPAKRIASRGLKGRSMTAEERRIQDAIGKMPCIACQLHGKISPIVSLHHIYGRTIKDAHKFVLPLCKWHHQFAAPEEVRLQHPWLIPVHADGNTGGKAAFIQLNADEATLYQMVISMV